MRDLQRRTADRVVTQSDLVLLRAEFKAEIARLELENEVEAFRRSMNAWGTTLLVAIVAAMAIVRFLL